MVVYVRLINEAIDVWAPVPAVDLGNRRYRLNDDEQCRRGLEDYEFPLGSVVMAEPYVGDSFRAVSLFRTELNHDPDHSAD